MAGRTHMTSIDWIKLAILLPLFGVGGPALGSFLRDKPQWQKWVFGLMCFMTINGLFQAGNWGLTLASDETYRGHAKGFHFYFNHILAIALITVRLKEDPKAFRWVPPGGAWYAAYIAISLLSIINAPRVDYVIMAAHKMIFFGVLFIASFNWLTDTGRIQFFMRVMAATLVWEAFIVLKMKYLNGIYQVHGTFEHQNPLSMYAVLIGMPLMAVAMGPEFRGRGLCLAGFVASAVIVESALSRASLVLFVVGAAMVTLTSLVEKPTVRRLSVIGVLGLVGTLGLMFTLNTIVGRFNDKGNQASSELRIVLNEIARQMVKDHPLGIGWNNYALCVNRPFRYIEYLVEWNAGRGMQVDETQKSPPVESHYYLLLGENGWLGLASYLLVIAVALWRNIHGLLSFRHSFERCLCIGMISGCFLNYFQSTLERVLTQPRNLMLWLILFGITGRLEVMRRERKSGIPVGALPVPADRPAPVLVARPAGRSFPWPGVLAAKQPSATASESRAMDWPTPLWTSVRHPET